jgi:beta-N-acetylhexosaminidase
MAATNCAPLIVGVPGAELDDHLRAVLNELNPVGFIIFKRNIKDREQLIDLVDEFSSFSTLETPIIAVDQEGGRVNRLNELPYIAPPQRWFGELYEKDKTAGLDAAEKSAFLVAAQLAELGFTMNCVPCADLLLPQTHGIIGNRSFGESPQQVAELAAAVIRGTLAGGLWPIIKHAPGHGRAEADSHLDLPLVETPLDKLEKTDFIPFKHNASCPFVMTAHITYPALDAQQCMTHSAKGVQYLRQNLGLSGLLVGDDLAMEALNGTLSERLEATLAAHLNLAIWGGSDMHTPGAATPTYMGDISEFMLNSPRVTPATAQLLADLPPLSMPDDAAVHAAYAALKSYGVPTIL